MTTTTSTSVSGLEHADIVDVRVSRHRSVLIHTEYNLRAGRESLLLCGEKFTVLEEHARWVRGVTEGGDVGFVQAHRLVPYTYVPSHRVVTLLEQVYNDPDHKSHRLRTLPMNSLVSLREKTPSGTGIFHPLQEGGWIYGGVVFPRGSPYGDIAAAAELYQNASYFWGGRSFSPGVDCSGLVKQALLRARGTHVPHSANKIRTDVIPGLAELAPCGNFALQRNDLVFWKGHVGIMVDHTHIIHATADYMKTVVEDLATVINRRNQNSKSQGRDPVLGYRRPLPMLS